MTAAKHTPLVADLETREVINPNAVLRDLYIVATVHADDEEGTLTTLFANAPRVAEEHAAMLEALRELVNNPTRQACYVNARAILARIDGGGA